MWAKILSTVFVRGYAAIANLILVMVTAKILGAEVRGEIALVILGVTIIGMFQAIIGGPSLTYFASKRTLKSLIINSTVWSVLAGSTIGLFISFIELSPWHFVWLLITIAVTQGIVTAQHSYLVGREKVFLYGALDAIRTTILWSYVIIRFFVFKSQSIDEVLLAYVFANALTVFLGFVVLFRNDFSITGEQPASLNEMFRYGSQIQLNNLSQLFNYRYVFYVVEKLKGTEALGVFSVAVAVAESIWIICKSIATIQLSRLVNVKEITEQRKITLKLAVTSVTATVLATVIILVIPDTFYTYLFGKDFSQISGIILWFSPAILLLSFYTILNHYFIARNENWTNIKASIFGNILLLISSNMLIIHYSLAGAALVYGIAYLGISGYLLVMFMKRPPYLSAKD